MKKYPLLILLLLGLTLCFAGCGNPRLDLHMASQPNVNPDHSGRPSPVVVKVYELRNEVAFKQADFQSLFERPVPTLGADLVAADELVLIPGEARKIAYQPTPGTRFLGIVAGFRQMERAQWRTIMPIDPKGKNLMALELNDASILVIPEKNASSWDPEKAVREYQQAMSRPDASGEAAPASAPSNDAAGQTAPASSTRVMQPY